MVTYVDPVDGAGLTPMYFAAIGALGKSGVIKRDDEVISLRAAFVSFGLHKYSC